MKIEPDYDLYTHLINEMGLKYLLESNKIKISLSSGTNLNLEYSFEKDNIDSWKEFLKVKSLSLFSCDFSLEHIFILFPNIQKFASEYIDEDDLKYLILFKKLEILDISRNKKIVDLSSIKNILTLNKLILNDSNVDLSTLVIPNDSIKEIIISKEKYTKDIDKLFPSRKIKKTLENIIENTITIKL